VEQIIAPNRLRKGMKKEGKREEMEKHAHAIAAQIAQTYYSNNILV
jgi:hypothetical protein